MTEKKKEFRVLVNENYETDKKDNNINQAYKTNPINVTNPLKEKLIKHVDSNNGKKFSPEDLLKW